MRGVLVLTVVLVGCGGSASTPDTPSDDHAQLAQAMCADLRDDFSMFQMHAQAVEFYQERGRSGDAAQLAAAQLEDLATSRYCPEFREAFEATFAYEDWIAP